MEKKERKILYFLLISHIYCLILAWFNGDKKLNFLIPYFFAFLLWWCVWNSLLTIAFIILKLRKPKSDNYFVQAFSLIVMISNLISMVIYGSGIIIWLTTSLTTSLGITSEVKKLVPIPSHKLGEMEIGKVIFWWLYSPLWHFVAPAYFIYWFFCYGNDNFLKKRLKLTFFLCLLQPTLYFLYCFARTKISEKKWLEGPNFFRWPLPFLSSKTMAKKIGTERFVWKIILVIFWWSLFSLIVYFSLRFRKKIKKMLLNKKEVLTKSDKKLLFSAKQNIKNTNF